MRYRIGIFRRAPVADECGSGVSQRRGARPGSEETLSPNGPPAGPVVGRCASLSPMNQSSLVAFVFQMPEMPGLHGKPHQSDGPRALSSGPLVRLAYQPFGVHHRAFAVAGIHHPRLARFRGRVAADDSHAVRRSKPDVSRRSGRPVRCRAGPGPLRCRPPGVGVRGWPPPMTPLQSAR